MNIQTTPVIATKVITVTLLFEGYLAYKDMEVVGIKVIRRWFVCVFVMVVVRNVVEVFL